MNGVSTTVIGAVFISPSDYTLLAHNDKRRAKLYSHFANKK
jgi:hypothetical protein